MTRASDGEVLAVVQEMAPVWGGGVEEVPLLLTPAEMAALELEAHRLGMTAGQMMRLLVREFLRQRGH